MGHTMRKHDSLEKDIITGTLPGKRARGRPKTSWMNNIIAWTGLTLNVILKKTKEISEWISCHLACGQPSDRGRLKEEEEMNRLINCTSLHFWFLIPTPPFSVPDYYFLCCAICANWKLLSGY